MTIGSWS